MFCKLLEMIIKNYRLVWLIKTIQLQLLIPIQDVPNGFDLLDQKLQDNVDKKWMESYEERNGESIRFT